MSIGFLNPLLLLGLAAGLLPLLIHLISRRQAKPLSFPAVRFILLSQRRQTRRYRLRHLLLLLLRTMAVLLLATALAHPRLYWRARRAAASSPGPKSSVLIVDTSLSMSYEEEGEQRLQQAKRLLRQFIQGMGTSDQAAVLSTAPGEPRVAQGTGTSGEGITTTLHGDRAHLLQRVEQMPLSFGQADFLSPLRTAYGLLRQSPSPEKEIVLLTDFTQPGWDQFHLREVGRLDPQIKVNVVRVGHTPRPANLAVRTLQLISGMAFLGVPAHLEFLVGNYGGEVASGVQAELWLEGVKREQQFLEIPARGETRVTFKVVFDRPGHSLVELKLGPHPLDHLAGDNRFFAAIPVRERIKVLVVDGDTRASALVSSESFYLQRTLVPEGEVEPSPFALDVLGPQELEGLDSPRLDRYQALILCNLPTLSASLGGRLYTYVQRGGGLMIFLGDQVDAASYQGALSPLLPARLLTKRIDQERRPLAISLVEGGHPMLAPFTARNRSELGAAQIWGRFQVTPFPDSRRLLTLSTQDPLLLEKRAGRGTVLLFTSSANRNWNDLPIKPIYLPLIQNAVLYLSGHLKPIPYTPLLTGEGYHLRAPEPAGKELAGTVVQVTPPRGPVQSLRLPAADREREGLGAVFTGTHQPGIYQIAFANGQRQTFAVNSPSSESDLNPLSREELAARLAGVTINFLEVQGGQLRHLTPQTDARELATPMLLGLFGILVVEGWLANRQQGKE